MGGHLPVPGDQLVLNPVSLKLIESINLPPLLPVVSARLCRNDVLNMDVTSLLFSEWKQIDKMPLYYHQQYGQ
jgi:hypothetical protein